MSTIVCDVVPELPIAFCCPTGPAQQADALLSFHANLIDALFQHRIFHETIRSEKL